MRTVIIAAIALVVGLVGGFGFDQILQHQNTTTDPTVASNMVATPTHDMASMEMSMDLGEADSEYDLRFIDAMMVHHAGAIDMALDVQENSTRPELLQLADEIIAAQQAEIQQMQAWRLEWYGNGSSGDATS